MSNVIFQQIFALNVGRLIQYISTVGYRCTLGEVFRTPEQAAIYVREGKGIKNSLHCKRLAIDLNLFSPLGKYLMDSEEYEKFGEYWESLHPSNKWGGRFQREDGGHFQMDEEIE